MSAERRFLDTNIILYLLSDDPVRAGRAEELLADRCVISVQVLNELANVMRRKLKLEMSEIEEVLTTVREVSEVSPLTLGMHQLGLAIAARFGYSIYDSMIIAAATETGCDVIWTEDMQSGQQVGKVTLLDPFQA